MKTLLIDDDEILRAALSQTFELAGLEILALGDPQAALSFVTPDFQGIIVSDVRMPSLDGISLFQRVRVIDAELPVILITGHGDVPMVVSAMRDGVFDFITKPFASDQLIASVKRALQTRRLVLENRRLRQAAEEAAQGDMIIGVSTAIDRVRQTIRQIARTDINALIEGETGTGKSMIAQILHKNSLRAHRPFVSINFSGMPSDVAEAQLFGQVRNGHVQARQSQIEVAHRGTLFLDEVEHMPLNLQSSLIQYLDPAQGGVMRGTTSKPLNVRIIAATTQDLRQRVADGRFRSDLYYCLSTVQLQIPSLRNRQEDVLILFSYFLSKASRQLDMALPDLNDEIRSHLINHDWPSNVRELQAYAQRCVLGLTPETLPYTAELSQNQPSLPQRMERFEDSVIRGALEQAKGDVRETMHILGIPRKTFYDKAQRHQIDINIYRQPKSRGPKLP